MLGSLERAVIQSKLVVPALSDHVVERPRLHEALADLISGHRVVVVSATAGAGKTTAVVSAVEQLDQPVAWLSVDRTDAAPGRLVTYLEAAVARRLAHVAGAATDALEAGIPHAEAAGLLAEAIGDERLVLVLDDLERLGEEADAWAVVESFLRYAPAGVSAVLVSRREIPTDLCALPPHALAASLGESELAFTPTEAAGALARAGKEGIDAAAAVEATGGWVTGVLFEVWRSAEHVVGRGGEADPLYGYLSSDILGQLAEEDREFLVSTSLLDEVTAAGAETLGLKGAGERLVALRAAHLPVAWSADGHAMRCHSRFREYLVERLERRGYEAVRELRLAYARHLAAEGLDEDAAEEFLRADEAVEALPLAEAVIGRVIERGDFAIADRWLQALADLAPAGASALTVAELMLGAAREDLRSVVRIADQLEALGERDELAATSDAATWLMVWGYISLIRPDDVLAVLNAAEPGPIVDAARYATQVMLDPARGPLARPALTGGPVDAFVYIADYALGHLGELTAESESRWAELVKGQWRIAALRATGQTERALELYEAGTGAETLSLQTWIGPELLLDAGRTDEARAMVVKGRRIARESGSAASEGMNALAEAKLRLRADRDPAAAREVLDRPEIRRVTSVFGYIREVADAWYGLALLWQGEDEAALARLHSATGGMTAGARELELPTAAVYLAEAEWRAGDEAAADRAADLALDAARRQGSNHLFLQALADFPAVASRRIDAESGADSPWHEVGRALIAQGVALAATVRASIELREFGQRAILVNGEGVKPRIAKTYEVLAVLSARRPAQARRDELLEALFGGRSDDSARAYLRQAVHWLRQTLPEGAILVEGGVVRLSEGIEIDAESVRFERRLAEAARLQDAQRLAATLAALEIYDRGDYLPGLRSAWADERHAELADLASGARYEAAELAFAAADYEQARTLVDTTLAADPFREAAWRLLMRIAEPLGDEKGVLRAYHGCERALGRLGTTPSPSTRQLLESLRR